jgi:hypothetical protein
MKFIFLPTEFQMNLHFSLFNFTVVQFRPSQHGATRTYEKPVRA